MDRNQNFKNCSLVSAPAPLICVYFSQWSDLRFQHSENHHVYVVGITIVKKYPLYSCIIIIKWFVSCVRSSILLRLIPSIKLSSHFLHLNVFPSCSVCTKGPFHRAIFPHFFCFENVWKCRNPTFLRVGSDIFTHFQNTKKWENFAVKRSPSVHFFVLAHQLAHRKDTT